MARCGAVGRGLARNGRHGAAGNGGVGLGVVWLGMLWFGRRGSVGHGKAS